MRYLLLPLLLCVAIFAGCTSADLARAEQEAQRANAALVQAQAVVAQMMKVVEDLKPLAEKSPEAKAVLLVAQEKLASAEKALPVLAESAQSATATLADLKKQADENGGNLPWYTTVGAFFIHYAPRVLLALLPGSRFVQGLAGLSANFNWSVQATPKQKDEDNAKVKGA